MHPLFLLPFTTGLIFVLAGYLMRRFPPKGINALYGYRTPASMKSPERWTYAQRRAAVELKRAGVALGLLSVIGMLVRPSEPVGVAIGVGMLALMAGMLIVRVERALRRRFGR
jgi:uncharacterized membrane protein